MLWVTICRNTITPFSLRFNNHKSALNRYGRGQRNICRQQLYAHFWGEGHSGLSDFLVQVIDVTDVNNPTERESFWIEKLNSYVPRGLKYVNVRVFKQETEMI